MADMFKAYSMKVFKELNDNIIKQFDRLESQQIEKNINNIVQFEDILNQSEAQLDKFVNKMIKMKINKEINNELNFIN
jgi:ubiquinone biosynthesis protein Coq4